MKKAFFLVPLLLVLLATQVYAAIEVAFSPNGQSLNLILSAVSHAKKSICVAAYSFTSKPIATALVEAHKRGVIVKVVADAKSNTKYTAATFLANQGVSVRLNSRYAIFHHKFMVIDDRTVETGSFNYSAAAVNKNAENVIILYEMPEIAQQYAQEWLKLWDEGIDLGKKY
jgi:phosphatidylserine/phosphatidylglycerophosphate/cardiolipin synthase-like enzyme